MQFVRQHDLQLHLMSELVAESEFERFRFLSRMVEEWQSGVNRFDRPGEALFAAIDGSDMAAICGLNIDPYAADDEVGRLRHLYVRRAWRRQGVGRRLAELVASHARRRFTCLRLRADNPIAAQFYESLGWLAVAAEGDSTHCLKLRG